MGQSCVILKVINQRELMIVDKMKVLEGIGEKYIGSIASSEVVFQILEEMYDKLNLRTHQWSVYWDDEDVINVWTDEGFEAFDIQLASGEIAHFDFNTPSLKKLLDVMICPMCESGILEHRAVENPKSVLGDGHTHMYVCDTCPAIMVEWYDDSDTEAFGRGIQ